MMKKVVAVLLLGCMLCLALAGCGKTDLQKSQEYMDSHPLQEKKLYSVSFCLVSDEAIDASLLSGMQESFNRYAEENYNIHVEFTNVTAAEYGDWLDARFEEVAAASAARKTAEEAASAALATYVEIAKEGTAVEVYAALAAYSAAVAAAYAGAVPDVADAASAAAEAATYAEEAAAAAAKEDQEATFQAAMSASAAASAAAQAAGYAGAGSLGSDVRKVYPQIGRDQFDIIYIADYDSLCELVEAGRLRNLYGELTGKDYRLIKKSMTEHFFNCAILNETLYAVPNCRVMAKYKYMRVNAEKAIALNYPLESCFTDYQSTTILQAGIKALGEEPADYVQRTLIGDYAERFALAEDGAWWVYSTETEQRPAINQTDLFNGALAVTSFAYVDDNGTKLTQEDDFCPAVKILYEIDSDPALHTILQYGVPGITYNLKTAESGDRKGTVVSLLETEASYRVDKKYTGNSFSLYPTEEEFAANAQEYDRRQNADTTVKQNIYDVNVTIDQPKDAQCAVTISRPFAKNNQKVLLTAVPAEGYEFKEWTVGTTDENEAMTENPMTLYFSGNYNVLKATFVKAETTTETETTNETEPTGN